MVEPWRRLRLARLRNIVRGRERALLAGSPTARATLEKMLAREQRAAEYAARRKAIVENALGRVKVARFAKLFEGN